MVEWERSKFHKLVSDAPCLHSKLPFFIRFSIAAKKTEQSKIVKTNLQLFDLFGQLGDGKNQTTTMETTNCVRLSYRKLKEIMGHYRDPDLCGVTLIVVQKALIGLKVIVVL